MIPKNGGEEANVVYTVFWFLRKENTQWKITRQIWNEKPLQTKSATNK
jgi:ketosteroid isomerase-like protein